MLGGKDDRKRAVSSCFSFVAEEGKEEFITLAPLSEARYGASAFVRDGHLFCVGGKKISA